MREKNMRGVITRIDHKKHGNGAKFQRVYFKPEQGKGTFWKTDLCPTYRNWPRWAPLLKVGNELAGLTLKDPRTVDADCYPRLIRQPKAPVQEEFSYGRGVEY
jgi:hypothetical protein